MRLYETISFNAINNPFIKSLFEYRVTRSKIQQLINVSSDLNADEIAKLCLNAAMDYEKAITHAIKAASPSNVDKNEQKDFKDWLLWNKTIILGVFLDLQEICKNHNEEVRANFIFTQAFKCVDKINDLEIEEKNSKKENLADINAKYNELNRAKKATVSRPHNDTLRKHYAQRFFDLVKTLVNSELLEICCSNNEDESLLNCIEEIEKRYTQEQLATLDNIYNSCDDQTKEIISVLKAINEHYHEMPVILERGTSNENEEFWNEWNNFRNVIVLIKNGETRKRTLNSAIESSIKLCHVWETKNNLEKLKFQLESVVKNTKKKLEAALADVKPIKIRAKEFITTAFGTLLWPIIAPVLGIFDLVSGSDRNKKYHDFLAKHWKEAYDFSCSHPFIALAMALGFVGAIVFSVVGLASLSVGIGISISSTIHSTIISSGGFGFGYVFRSVELKTIKKKYKQEIEQLKSQIKKQVYGEQKNHTANIETNKKISELERDKDKLNDLEELMALRSMQNERSNKKKECAKQKEKVNKHDTSEINENKIKEQTQKAQMLFEDLTLNCLEEAQDEFKCVLYQTTLKLNKITEDETIIVDEMKLSKKNLHELDIKNVRIRESFEQQHRKVFIIDPQTHVAKAMTNIKTLQSTGI